MCKIRHRSYDLPILLRMGKSVTATPPFCQSNVIKKVIKRTVPGLPADCLSGTVTIWQLSTFTLNPQIKGY